MANQLDIDPYAPPGTIVADPVPLGYRDLPRISSWWVVPLTIVTLGVYPSYWLYSRIKVLNALSPSNAIPIALPIAGLVLSLASMAANWANDFFHDVMGVPPIAAVLQIAFLIVNLVCVFMVRDVLRVDHAEGSESAHHMSGLATFFLQVLYLNYKLNQRIDSERKANPLGEADRGR